MLSQAAARGDVLPLYVVESELWCEADMSGRQWAFVAEALEGLKVDLQTCGQPLLVRTGEMIDVLNVHLST